MLFLFAPTFLLSFLPLQHAIRFVTGYGIEGSLPDATCKRIQQRYMVPAFKQGDTNQGMILGVKAVKQTLDGTMETDSSSEDSDGWAAVALFLFIVGLMAFSMLYSRKHPCPQCHQRSLRHTSTDYYTLHGTRYRKDIYRCSKCGKIVVRDKPIDDPRHRGGGNADALLTGLFLGSMLGGRRSGGYSGGGFTGGSFGGGDTGGGGAGSNW